MKPSPWAIRIASLGYTLASLKDKLIVVDEVQVLRNGETIIFPATLAVTGKDLQPKISTRGTTCERLYSGPDPKAWAAAMDKMKAELLAKHTLIIDSYSEFVRRDWELQKKKMHALNYTSDGPAMSFVPSYKSCPWPKSTNHIPFYKRIKR